jgi:hypothetical protein
LQVNGLKIPKQPQAAQWTDFMPGFGTARSKVGLCQFSAGNRIAAKLKQRRGDARCSLVSQALKPAKAARAGLASRDD